MRARRWRWVALAAGLLAPQACGSEFTTPSEISALRVIAVQPDKSYAAPGEDVTVRLTYHDGLGETPREVQVAWFAGCANPPGGAYFGCYPQLAQSFATGGFATETLTPDQSGAIGAAEFSFTVPADVLETAPPPLAGNPVVGSSFVLFAVCAGTLSFVEPEVGEGFISLPLVCLDENGNPQGADHFVPGYTQVFTFADGRTNVAPPADAITVEGVEATDTAADTPVVACANPPEEGCGAEESTCTQYNIKVVTSDVAEPDSTQTSPDGEPLREVMWVDYYADGGTFDTDRALVSDAERGFQNEFEALWTPPAASGPVRVWAVVHDNRGGMNVASAMVLVE